MNLNENAGRGRSNRTIQKRNLEVKTNNYPLQAPSVSQRNRNANAARTSTTSSEIVWGQHRNRITNSSNLNTGSTTRTTITSENELTVLVLTEGRGEARCEVGIAAMNVTHPFLVVCQISDTHSYICTLTKINILNPNEILVPLPVFDASPPNRLVEKIKQKFPHIKLTGFARNAFNKAYGIERIGQVCLPSHNSVLLVLQHKYYALAAASALFLYCENNLYHYYAKESIKVEYQESEDAMIIDISTADNLELVASARPSAATSKFSSLFGVLNHCITRIGSRTLRSTILQPSCCVPDIEGKLDCIEELIKKPDMLIGVQTLLRKLTNIDQLLTLGTLLPDSALSCSERHLNYLLLVSVTLDQILPLKTVFEDTNLPFFTELKELLSSEEFTSVKNTLRKVIHSDAHPSKGYNAIMQRCFAVKEDVNGLLDMVRKVFSERLEEMREYVASLSRKYGLQLTLNNNTKKGYHIVFPLTKQQKRTLKKSDLPDEFIQVNQASQSTAIMEYGVQVCRLAGSYTMKTATLQNFSVRLDDMLLEILKLSNVVIHNTLIEIRNYLGLFYILVENIAKLDVLQSLAQASMGNRYVRPSFGDYLDVANSKHPMLDFLCKKEPISNPVQASKEYNTHIITGPNGSGKSIYIRQIALIHIMAQIGCYVPASTAVLRVSDRLFARISLDDNMECGASTFEVEMREIKYFLTQMTKNSLVIIDELGRSTSVEEGTALALAITEKMMKFDAFIFLTTHFTLITKLQEMYFNVKVWQLEAHATGTSVKDTKLSLMYNLLPGCTNLRRYSVYLVRKLWPENIVTEIGQLLDEISETTEDVAAEKADEIARFIYDIEAELKCIKYKKKLTKAAINTTLNKYMQQIQEYGIKIAENFPNSESYSSRYRQMETEKDNYFAKPTNNTGDFNENTNLFKIPAVSDFSAYNNNQPDYNMDQQQNANFTKYRDAQVNDDNSNISYELYNHSDKNSFDTDMLIPEISMTVQSPLQFLTPPDNLNEICRQIDHDPPFFETPNQTTTVFPPLCLDSSVRTEGFFNKLVTYSTSSQSSSYSSRKNNDGLNVVDFGQQHSKTSSFQTRHKMPYQNTSSSSTNEIKFARPLQRDAARTSTPLVNNASKSQLKTNWSCFPTNEVASANKIVENNSLYKTFSDAEISSILEDLESCDEFFSDFNTSATNEEQIMDKNKESESKTDSESNSDSKSTLKWKKISSSATDESKEKQDNLKSTLTKSASQNISELSEKHFRVGVDQNSLCESSTATTKTEKETLTRIATQTTTKKLNYSVIHLDRINPQQVKSGEVNNMLDQTKSSESISYSPICKSPNQTFIRRDYTLPHAKLEDCELQKKRSNEIMMPSNVFQENTQCNTENVNTNESESRVAENKVQPNNEVIENNDVASLNCNAGSTNVLVSPVTSNSVSKSTDNSTSLQAKESVQDAANCSKSETASSSKSVDNVRPLQFSQNKRKKFKAPFKLESKKSKKSSEDSLCSTTQKTTRNKRRWMTAVARFKPPKITKRQIETEFKEQDRKMMENLNKSNASEYLQQLLNRPSVRQMQQSKHIALLRKTEDGVVVIPAEAKKPRKHLGLPSSTSFMRKNLINVSIFSDKNADKFAEFLQKKKSMKSSFTKKSKSFCFGDSKEFCDKTSVTVYTELSTDVSRKTTTKAKRQNTNVLSRNAQNLDLFSQSNVSQSSVSKYLSLTPDGYYKGNKSQINNIVNKYLETEEVEMVEKQIKYKNLKSWNSSDSIFT